MNARIKEPVSAESDVSAFWFPGRWVGGFSLIIGPLLLLTAALLRIQFHFFYDAQLAAYTEHPARITAAYRCFMLGSIFLWPGIIVLVGFIAVKQRKSVDNSIQISYPQILIHSFRFLSFRKNETLQEYNRYSTYSRTHKDR